MFYLPVLFLMLSSAHAQVGAIPLGTLRAGMAITTPLIDSSNRRAFTDQEVAENLNSSFRSWQICHGAKINKQPIPSDCDCAPASLVVTDADRSMFIFTACLPPRRDQNVVFNSRLTDDQKAERDRMLCGCILNNQNAVENLFSNAPTRQSTDLVNMFMSLKAVGLVLTAREESGFSETYSAGISATNIADSRSRATPLAGVYISNQSASNQSDLQTHTNTSHSAVGQLQMSQLLSVGDVDDQICLPYRDFLNHKQFSLNPNFQSQLDGEFNESDWNYESLAARLPDASAQDQFLYRDKVGAKLEFLINNPLLKNIFLSQGPGSSDTKKKLFLLLKRFYPRPQCSDVLCNHPDDMAQKAAIYKRELSQFLSRQTAIDNAQTGLAFSAALASRARDAFGQTTARYASSDQMFPENPLARPYQEWRSYCQIRMNPQPITASQEIGRLHAFERLIGRNYRDPKKDEEYMRVNQEYCQSPRRNGSNTRMNFSQFRTQSCNSIRHRECFAKFITAFPYPGVFRDLDTNINYAFKDGVRSPELDDVDSSAVIQIAANPHLRERSVADLRTNNFSTNPTERYSQVTDVSALGASSATAVVVPSSGTSSMNPASSRAVQPSSVPFTPELIPSVAGAGASVVAAPPRKPSTELRSQIKESDAFVDDIRGEISSLKSSLESPESAPAERKDTQLATLEERLAALEDLEQRLAEELAKNVNLRRQLAETNALPSDQVIEGPSPNSPKSSSGNNLSRLAGAESSPSNVIDQGTAGAPVSPLASLGRGNTLSSGRNGPTPSGPTRSPASFGIPSTSAQGGIVVANASSEINYEELQNRSEGSRLSLPVELAEYNLIAANNQRALKPYIDRCLSLAAEVCRFNISATGAPEPLEFFVVKSGVSGSEVSIVPASNASRGLASRVDSEPLTANGRENTLRGLRSEMGLGNEE